MALTIAGTGAGAGYQGVAPQAKILPVKIETRTGAGSSDGQIAQGIRWAVDHGADIVNVSTGNQDACPPVEADAVQYAYDRDVLVIAAAGNEGQPSVSSPGDCCGTLAVTANDRRFEPWPHANNGPALAFTAEGVNVAEETLTGAKIVNPDTSSATALVSGTFALLRAHFPTMSSRDLVTRALWNVHNGLGGSTFAKKLDRLGYGEILPYHALHDPLPANATNPIYTAWEGLLGPAPRVHHKAAPASPPPNGASSPASGSSAPAQQGGMPQTGGDHSSGGSGLSTSVIVGVVAAVTVVGAGLIVLFARRRGRQRAVAVGEPPSPPPPSGPTYG